MCPRDRDFVLTFPFHAAVAASTMPSGKEGTAFGLQELIMENESTGQPTALHMVGLKRFCLASN